MGLYHVLYLSAEKASLLESQPKSVRSVQKTFLEDFDHLFISCPFSHDLWKKVSDILKGILIATNIVSLCKDICSHKTNVQHEKDHYI